MQLKGRRVLVVGLGRTGVAVAAFCAGRRALVTVTDRKPADLLAAEVAELRGRARLELGGHTAATFLRQDLIVLSPGVPEIPEVVAARAAGVAVTGEIELAAGFVRAPMVGITGTNGKSTVTSLVGAILAATGRPTFAGGNLGDPLIAAVDTPAAAEGGHLVVELSSFQLETCQELRPAVAALLNVTPDHLDRYPSMDAYVAAKGRIFQAQTPADFAVVNADDPIAGELAGRGRARVLGFSSTRPLADGGWLEGATLCLRLPAGPVERYPSGELHLVGRHNLENALAAFLCARLQGAAPAVVRAAAREFHPLQHRLELVRELDGVAYYDDSKGTNVGAVAAALEGFPRRVVLIAGGRDKGGDYAPLRRALAARARAVVLIGEAADRMAAALDGVAEIRRARTLEEAVQLGRSLARAGDAVVLSPACSSFDMFRDYAHRAAVFRAAVLGL
ncbi:MAG: UDP-N-acetylmuramoyl-L-alanine--D-glutamate ligase [Deltaproteobacteria bacterium]|nr:UDP-N-acetylmuramoyl-L-alanine--D-glutamate ligase [Deltaproteobacteria bacterium]